MFLFFSLFVFLCILDIDLCVLVGLTAYRPMTTLSKLGEDFLEYCRGLPNDYKAEKCGWYLREIQQMTSLSIEFYTAQQNNWQVQNHCTRHTPVVASMQACHSITL